MKKIKWEKVGTSYLLTSREDELIRLQYDAVKSSSFVMNDREYLIHREGFWNQRYIISENGNEAATLSHNFWGSKGRIQFADGIAFYSDYKYKNILTLRFLDGDSEILCYHVEGEPGKQFAEFSVGIAIVDAEKLLLMTALGMVMFLNIFNEFNSGDDSGPFIIMAGSG